MVIIIICEQKYWNVKDGMDIFSTLKIIPTIPLPFASSRYYFSYMFPNGHWSSKEFSNKKFIFSKPNFADPLLIVLYGWIDLEYFPKLAPSSDEYC